MWAQGRRCHHYLARGAEEVKLFYCQKCKDIQKMMKHTRACFCGQSWGRYMSDGCRAEIGGSAVPVGIVDSSLDGALANRQPSGRGTRFTAYVSPLEAAKINVIR